MTTITYPDVTHKKPVAGKFNPNSYRVLSEEVSATDSIPFWYGHSRPPPLLTEPDPSELPAQALEARNNPHAARKVDMVYTNMASMNAPLGVVKTDNVQREESRWWDWSPPAAEPYGPAAKSQDEWAKTRESSYRNTFSMAGEAGPYAKKNSRYSASPQHIRTVGIVPVTDLKPNDTQFVDQKLVEKVSFEQQYNSRNATNYPLRGRRHGTFVIDAPQSSIIPPNRYEHPTSAGIDRAASMWDLFHPTDELRGQRATNPYKFQRPAEVTRTQTFQGAWQNAPYATDHTFDQLFQRQQSIVD